MEAATELDTEQLLCRIGSDIETLIGRGLNFRMPAELVAVLDAGVKLRSQVDCLVSLTAAEVDRFGIAKDLGYRTVAQMVGDRTGADPKQTRADVRLGRWIDDFEQFAAVWAAGAVTTAHLDLIRRTVDSSDTHAALVDDQEPFVEWVGDYDFVDFGHICKYWMNAEDPDGKKPKDQIEKSYFKATKRADGCVEVDGLLDPLTGDAFMTAWAHESQKQFRATKNQADADSDEAPTPTPQSTGTRGVNALMALITRGFARKDGTFPIPLINIVASQQVAEDTITRINEPSDDPLPLAFDDIDKRCELADGTPLHPAFLLATLGLATFRRQIMTATGRTIDVSVNSRGFTPWQKQALIVQARGRCQTKGCDAPFSWLHADHVHPHSEGGATIMDNGAIKCEPDNLAKGNRIEPLDPDKKRESGEGDDKAADDKAADDKAA